MSNTRSKLQSNGNPKGQPSDASGRDREMEEKREKRWRAVCNRNGRGKRLDAGEEGSRENKHIGRREREKKEGGTYPLIPTLTDMLMM